MTIILDGTTGITTPAINSSGDLELPGGTANGVLYLNGSKVATSGSALVFDGTNLGVGVTPSAWGTAGGAALQVKNAALISYANADVEVLFNTYFDGSNYKYISNGFATRYDQVSGTHAWYTAASGTAGGTITFGDAKMTLNALGNLGVGTTSPGNFYRLTINGAGTGGNPLGGITFRQNETDVLYFGNIATDNNTDWEIWNPRNGYLRFATNNIERARITATGDLLLGTTSSLAKLTIASGQIRITGATVASGFASNTIRIAGAQDVADDATVTVGISNSSLVFVAENNVGTGILFFCGYASGTVVKIADPSGIGATADTDNFICATKSATSSDLNIKNRLGSTKSITISVFSVSD